MPQQLGYINILLWVVSYYTSSDSCEFCGSTVLAHNKQEFKYTEVVHTLALVLETKGHLWSEFPNCPHLPGFHSLLRPLIKKRKKQKKKKKTSQVSLNPKTRCKSPPSTHQPTAKIIQTRVELVCNRDVSLLTTLKCADCGLQGLTTNCVGVRMLVFLLCTTCYCRDWLRLPFAH